MDYEKKYKEALEKAREWYNKTEPDSYTCIVESIFPELKESEDEMIKYEIIAFVEQSIHRGGGTPIPQKQEDRWIAWLEKQDKQKPADTDNKFIRMRETKPKDISEFLDRLTTVEQEFLWEHIAKIRELDKEEQKPVNDTDEDIVEAVKDTSILDKVEPKFKTGQWIVWQDKYYKVNYNGCGYELIDQNGLSTSLEYGTIEESAYLWDISKDAKDGDVLYSPSLNLLWIFKSRDTVYFGCNLNYTDGAFCGEGYFERPTNAIPATKKQRDLLFKKIHEAGYMWDADKKELRKIENEHICELDNLYTCVKFPFKAKVKSSGTIVTIHNGQLRVDGKEWIKYQSGAEDGYKIYRPNNLELVCEIEQNSAWSEEDKNILKT